jgi:hypothetical protein
MNLSELTSHVCRAVANANECRSGVSAGVLDLPGMSSPKVRHLINNLCAFPDCSYLEVGSWKGSTLCSAMDGQLLKRVCAYENFLEFADPVYQGESGTIEAQLEGNIECFRGMNRVELKKMDFFEASPAAEPCLFNVYLYDGMHIPQTQYVHLKVAKPALARYFVLLVDDWFCDVSKPNEITFKALNDFSFYIHAFIELPAGKDDGYWGGQGLFILENR